VREASY
jgi:hypothetical protein